MKPTSNASGKLEDGGHDRGKKASKLLDATTAFSSIVYGGIEEREVLATYVVVNKVLEVAKAYYLATISLSIGRFDFMLNISEFKVQLTRTTPPIIG